MIGTAFGWFVGFHHDFSRVMSLINRIPLIHIVYNMPTPDVPRDWRT
jgi:hypothetical protein